MSDTMRKFMNAITESDSMGHDDQQADINQPESSDKRRSRRSESQVREGREGSIPCPECGTMTYTDQTCSDRHCEKYHEYVGE